MSKNNTVNILGNNKIRSEDLVANCEKLLSAKTVYMWGCYGQLLTEDLIKRKAEQYPNRFSFARQTTLSICAEEKDYYACDCAGLIKNCLWGGFGNRLKYSALSDLGTESMKKAATTSGVISSLPETPGVIVYKKGHIGVYVGNGYVIECTLGSRGDGVVKTKLGTAGWTDWFYAPGITYSATPPVKKTPKKIYGLSSLFKKLIT